MCALRYIEVRKSHAQKAKAFLTNNGMLAKGLEVLHSARYVYFPVIISPETNKNLAHFSESIGARLVERGSARRTPGGRTDFNEAIARILDPKERKELARGYDPFGNIAMIEISDALKSKERDIGNAIIGNSSTITTVLAKSGPVKGVYRTRSVRYVAGKRTYIADYKENGCEFRFDVRRVFFSPRLSYERSRISKLVVDGEKVAVPFAGVGPFAIEIAKSHPKSDVVAIELNSHAYRYMLANARLNRVENLKAVNGDFMDVAGKFRGFADRVVMPMPKTSLDFIPAACTIAKKKAMFHIYTFCAAGHEAETVKRIRKKFSAEGRSSRLVASRTVRPYSKSEIEIVLDMEAGTS